jgi:hypothetical protein
MSKKKRTIDEYRQVKDTTYRPPLSHNNKGEENNDFNINMNEFMLYLKNRMETVNDNGLIIEVVAFSLKALKNNPNLSIYEAVEAGCEEWDL